LQQVRRLLADKAHEDQWRLVGEIQKLVAYDPHVTVENVELLVASSIERTIFELVEAVVAGRVAVAQEALQALRAARENDVYILTMIQWQLRNVLLVKLAPATMSPAEVASATGMNSFVASKAAVMAARLTESTIKMLFSDSIEAEYQIKTGQRPADVAVDLLVVKISNAARIA
jgi:DNA polymerase-3 subunit delta